MDQSYFKKHKRGKVKEISSYELLLRNSHELLWRKLSEYTLIHLSVIRVKVWFPELKLASNVKLDRCASVDSAISYIARKKKMTNTHCGLFLERHSESGIWLENNTPLWLYDLQSSDILEYKPRPAYNTTMVAIRVFMVEQKIFKSIVFDKKTKISELVVLFQVQFGLMRGDFMYYGFNLLTPEANEIWLEDDCTLSSYLVHNMSVIEYKKKHILVLVPVVDSPSVAKTCVLSQNLSGREAVATIGSWLMPSISKDMIKSFDENSVFHFQQNIWLEKETQIGVYPFKANDIIAFGSTADDVEILLQNKDICARVLFAAPARKKAQTSSHSFTIAGEFSVLKVANVLHLTNFTGTSRATLDKGVVGDICISNFRLTFCALQSPEVTVDIPIASIAKIDKKGKNKNENFNGYYLDILCKDNRLIRFYWPHRDESRKKLYHSLRNLSFPGDQEKLFAFCNEENFNFDGWNMYNFETEYHRQKISSKLWRVTHLNANFQMCESYPPLLIVPAKISDEQLRAVFEFRSKGRIPTMTWQHPLNGTTISRCSQPLAGIRMTRCTEDETLIREMGFATQPLIVDKLDKDLYVLDCRPKANAMGNRAKGAGYEDTTTSYRNCILEFLNIGNIHVMRESHEKLLDVCLQAVGGAPGGGWSGSGPSSWLSGIESSKWLDHLCVIMEAAQRVIDCIHHQGVSVLLHCSDGWDRTAQVSSLALILLDPYHRTLRGFVVLIEKEWLMFGHKFAQRHGFGDSKHLDERSPVFLQFLDCVWQLTQQFPFAFEFNESFLLAILHHLHSCRFGTFLFNSCSERLSNFVQGKTVSLWSFLLSPVHVHDYMNLFYEPQDQILMPYVSAPYFQIWRRAHLSWYCAIPQSVEAKLRFHLQNQAATIQKLQQQIEDLKWQSEATAKKSNPNSNMLSKHIRDTLSKRQPSANETTINWSLGLNSDVASLLNPSMSGGSSVLDSFRSESAISLSDSSPQLSPLSRVRPNFQYDSNEDDSDEETSSTTDNLSSSVASSDFFISENSQTKHYTSTPPRSPFGSVHPSLLPSSSLPPSRPTSPNSLTHQLPITPTRAHNPPNVNLSPNDHYPSKPLPKSASTSSTSLDHPPAFSLSRPRGSSIAVATSNSYSDRVDEPNLPNSVATYVSNMANPPRARVTTAGINNVAQYISHNYSLSDSAKLIPRGGSISNSSQRGSESFEETKWQQVRRTPSTRALHILDQSNRKFTPNINPARFSTS